MKYRRTDFLSAVTAPMIVSVLFAIATETAFAQTPSAPSEQDDGLTEITVTATKTGTTALQDTPLAVTAFSGETLAARGITDVNGLVKLTPGLQTSDQNGYTKLYIRGIGTNSVFVGSDPSSTIHLDGVYLARPLSYLSSFLDVERIEVVKGPQGTLYGRNSVGGTVNVISRAPSEVLTAQAQLVTGTDNLFGAKGYLSGPLGASGIRGSLAFNRERRDGYLKNVSTGPDLQDRDDIGVRGQLLFPIGESASLTLRGDYSDLDAALGGYPKLLAPINQPLDDSILNDFGKVAVDGDNRTQIRDYGTMAELNIPLNEHLALKSLSAVRWLRGSVLVDPDSSSITRHRTITEPRQQQFSQEFNLTANYDRLRLVLGAYYFDEHYREQQAFQLLAFTLPPGPAFPTGVQGATNLGLGRLEAKSYALFGQMEFDVTDRISVIAGARVSRDQKDFALESRYVQSLSQDFSDIIGAPVIGPPTFGSPFSIATDREITKWTPKLGVNFKPTEDLLLYASVSRGFKSGGFDFGATNAVDASRGYEPEYLWAYEGGVKAEWLNHTLRTNLAVFTYDYTDLQVKSLVPPANAVTNNAASADVKGFEFDVEVRPIPMVRLGASVAYLDAKYDEYASAFIRQFGSFDASGMRLNNAPEWSGAVHGAYIFDLSQGGSLELAADYHFQTVQYFTPANDGVNGFSGYLQKQPAHNTVDARISYESPGGRWSAALIGSNLTDESYVTGTADYTAGIAGTPGAPRAAMLQVGFRY